MIFADIDSISTTFNSTSADISLPPYLKQEDIVHAGLYWQGRFINQNIPNNASQILLKLPNETNYVNQTADVDFETILNSSPGFGPYNDYQGIADITTRFKKYIQSGTNNGTIMVANLQSSTQRNSFGAWMIVVAYKDKNSRMKNISIYDGFLSLTDTTPITETLSGFKTPKNGDVLSKFFVFGGEGDILWNLDSISLTKKDGTPVSLGRN
ncbi:MAG TPA: hypothetical protein ENK75_02620, partial [Saprospiraceae bacterium]|nr:hypothetical protein [Saprospiraceae bacterium]